MYFKDLVGQSELKSRLIANVHTGNIAHAQIFSGRLGYGTFGLALAYARYLNCHNPMPDDACGACPSCAKYDALAHPDLHFVFPVIKSETSDVYLKEWREMLTESSYFRLESWMERIDAGNTQPIIYSKESNEIIKKVSLSISESHYRVLMIWLPERMNVSCANKLLKLIEEPTPNSLILLVSESPDEVISTILSRCQRINVRPIENAELASKMKQIYKLTTDDAEHVAHLANGDFLTAIETISVNNEKAFFLEVFKNIMRNSWTKNVKGMKITAEELASIGRERQKAFFEYCQFLIRENFIYTFASPELNYLNSAENQFSSNFSPYVNERNVYSLMEELELADKHIRQNVNAKMVFFDLSLRLTVLLKQ